MVEYVIPPGKVIHVGDIPVLLADYTRVFTTEANESLIADHLRNQTETDTEAEE